MKVLFYVNASKKEVVELDDDLTDEEIDEEYETWRSNFLDGSWEKL